jgi:hypothetical protein
MYFDAEAAFFSRGYCQFGETPSYHNVPLRNDEYMRPFSPKLTCDWFDGCNS